MMMDMKSGGEEEDVSNSYFAPTSTLRAYCAAVSFVEPKL